jgi:polar amino acid transport system permease protein
MQGFDYVAFFAYLGNSYLLAGVVVTIWLTIVPMSLGLILGLILALARLSRVWWLSLAARGYIWIFRGTPLLIQLVIVYTGLPQVGIRFGVVVSAILALTLNESAYLSEIIRSGFLSVPRGQHDAAAALGLSRFQTLRKVLLPQVLRLIIPPLGNSVNSLLKATSLTSVISMEELMRRAQTLMQVRFEVLELFFAAAVWYLVLTTLWDFAQAPLERRFGRGYGTEEKPLAAKLRSEIS